ncbi:entericidin A/B family lipoprotein [Aquabacterium lacunae]|jgi:predicted small secreted protein|uniref:Entericidin A/B family lipoprotein n=1 Tax=Aquabacterium lacunae TaxID=2528630 RepID=A0A4Q9H2N6_9BURK|nr:entericidin A/B family lipoprotein [Aquabacterium lacunae]TBO32871.1 entericidin A/B family lipoprotein [Aquabacterium lacunae]
MKRLFALIAVASLFVLAGCNTMHGIGQDIQKAGDAISGASKK